MTGRPIVLTPLDLEILSEMYPSGRITIAGTDPRLSISRIARNLGTSRARVGARLHEWESVGMLAGYDVLPDPGLFHQLGASLGIRLNDPLLKSKVFERLALVDGVLQAVDYLGARIFLQLIAPDLESLGRRIRLVSRLEGIAGVESPVYWPPPKPRRPFSPLDMRIMTALRERPRATLSQIARSARISTRTMTDRYRELLDDHSLWFVPIWDFTHLASPVVSLSLVLKEPEFRTEILRDLRARLHGAVEFDWISGRPPGSERMLGMFIFASSAAQVDDIQALAASLEGVVSSETGTMVRVRVFRDTVDSLLRIALEGRTRPVSRAPPGATRA